MNKQELEYTLYVDKYRAFGNKKNNGKKSTYEFIKNYRKCRYYYLNRNSFLNKLLFKFYWERLRTLQIKYGIEISFKNDIGEGLKLPHYGGIVINGNVKIGKNCTILQGVTIGNNTFRDRNECAIIGDNVTIAAGAKIIGKVTIGNNVTIGANAVVTKDIPDGAVVAGIPAKVLSYKNPVLINTDYKTK